MRESGPGNFWIRTSCSHDSRDFKQFLRLGDSIHNPDLLKNDVCGLNNVESDPEVPGLDAMGIHEGWDVAVGWRTGLEHVDVYLCLLSQGGRERGVGVHSCVYWEE